ncbi:MAG TPA: nucleoid-associated protein [Pyrinomonadaceae bacterium]|jgi:hypothetical protein|nr:nucleoid-associated protein [Pyrinomonadaceae bacterium]
MKCDLAFLQINKIIIHGIPKHAKKGIGAGPLYSEIESPLDQDLGNYFKDRVITSLKSHKSYDVSFDLGNASPVPALLKEHLDSNKSDFINISKKIAAHLYAIQDGTNPEGLLTILDCSVNGKRALGLIKLEKEAGVSLEETLHENLHTFDLSIIRNLVLTARTKIYKVALFVIDDTDESGYDAATSDNQSGYGSSNEVASFFLSKFLGCKLKQASDVSTKHFYEAAEIFINERVEDPIERTQFHGHVVSEMMSQSPTVSTEQFAETYFPVEMRNDFVTALESKDVPENFPKDTTLIVKKLKKTLYKFQSGIQVIAPNEVNEEFLEVSKLENGKTKIEITDQLTEVKGK